MLMTRADWTGGVPVCAGVPGVKPVIVELTDFKTKEKVDELEVDAVLVATGRAPYTQVQALGPVTFQAALAGSLLPS